MTNRPEDKVGSRYGAPMGRHTGPTISYGGKISLRAVRLNSGGYDEGGAYWGLRRRGEQLYYYENEDGECGYLDAYGREDAKRKVLELVPDATFYR
jgi:hypothetical protein